MKRTHGTGARLANNLKTRVPRMILAIALLALLTSNAFAQRVMNADPLNYPKAWSDASWKAYTVNGEPIADNEASLDETTGGTTPTGGVDLTGTATETTAAAYYYGDGDNLNMRFRIDGPPMALSGASQPYVSSSWSVLMDTDGDGYKEFTLMLAGVRDSANASPDDIIIMYNDQPTQASNPETDTVWRQDVAKNPAAPPEYDSTLDGEDGESADWDADPDIYVWDFGRTRVEQLDRTLAPGSNNSSYFLDFQIPLSALDASSRGGPTLERGSIVRFMFSSANSNTNPFQKDFAYLSGYTPGGPDDPLPPGDPTDLDGNTYDQPVITDVFGSDMCSLSSQLVAQITARTETWNNDDDIRSTVRSVEFYQLFDSNSNSVQDGTESWVSAGTVTMTADATSTSVSGGSVDNFLGPWRLDYDPSIHQRGQYLVKAVVTDDVQWDGDVDSTDTVEASPTYNPGTKLEGAPVLGVFINTCGTMAPSLTKSANVEEVAAGGIVEFTLTVNNPTATPLSLTSLTDMLPDGFSFIDTVGGTLAPTGEPAGGAVGDIEWTFAPATVAAGSSETLVFTSNAAAASGTYANTAVAATSSGNLSSEPVQIGVGDPRLTLSVTADVDEAVPGQTITYTLTYSNDSPVNATDVILEAALPSELAYVAASATEGGVYDSAEAPGAVRWSIGDLPSGDGPYSVTFQAQVDDPYPAESALLLPLTGTIDGSNTEASNDTASVYIDAPRPQLVIQLSADKVLTSAGETIVFTLDYVNIGNRDATNSVMVFDLKPGFTTVLDSGGGTEVANTSITWNLGTIAAGAGGAKTVQIQVGADYTTNPTEHFASLDSDQTELLSDTYRVGIRYEAGTCDATQWYFTDTAYGANPFTFSASLTEPGAVASITGFPSPTIPNNNTYNLFLTLMQETAFANQVKLTSANPVSLTFYLTKANKPLDLQIELIVDDGATSTVIATHDPNTSASLRLTNAQTAVITLDFAVDATIQPGERLGWRLYGQGNAVDITSFDIDPASVPDSGYSYCGEVIPPAELVLDKQVSSLTANPGDTLEYTLEYTNIGGQTATSATLVDTLPTGLSYVAASASTAVTEVGGVLTFDLGSLAPNDSGTITFSATVDKPLATTLGTISNSATIDSAETSPVEDFITTTILQPDVSISKSVDKTRLGPSELATYTLEIKNTGTGGATNVTITDTLPLPAEGYYSLEGDVLVDGVADAGAVAGSDLEVVLPTLDVGESVTITYAMRVAATGLPDGTSELGAGLTAAVTDAETTDPSTSEAVVVAITASANLLLTLQVEPAGPVAAADLLTYTATVQNSGASDALLVQLRNPVPQRSSFASGTITYGGVSQTDSAGDDAGSFDAVENRIFFELGTLAAGETVTLKWQTTVDPVLPSGETTISSTASASASNTATKQATAEVVAEAAPQLNVVKSGPLEAPDVYTTLATEAAGTTGITVADSTYLVEGELVSISGTVARIVSITGNAVTLDTAVTAAQTSEVVPVLQYTLSYSNGGTAAASGVVVSDDLAAGLDYISATPAPDAEPAVGTDGPLLEWTIGDLPVGAVGSITILARPDSSGTFVNSASVESTEVTTPVTSNEVTTQIGMLRVSKVTGQVGPVHNDPDAPPGPVSYTITVSNSLAAPATGVYLVDVLPKGFTFDSTTSVTPAAACADLPTEGDATPEWGNCEVPATGSLEIEFLVNVGASVDAGIYDNDVQVFSDGVGVLQFRSDLTDLEDVEVTVPEAAGFVVSGVIYHDANANGALDGGEDWTGGPTVFVNLVADAAVQYTTTVELANGQFEISEVEAATYTLVVSSSSTGVAAVNPAGWLFISPSTGSTSVEVVDQNVSGLQLGLFKGSTVSGVLFRDDGLGGGTANDGLQNGNEESLSSLTVTASAGASKRTADTDSNGSYQLYLPYDWGNAVEVSHSAGPGTGVHDGTTVTAATSYDDEAARSATVDAQAGASYTRNFALVRASEFRPDQSGQAISPGATSYTHLYRPGTQGVVSFAADGDHSYEFFFDDDCNGKVSDAERVPMANHQLTVDGTWPRTQGDAGELMACAVEVRVLVDGGVASGRTDIASMTADLLWANLAAVTDPRGVVDITVVHERVDLMLTTTVKTLPDGTETTFAEAYPGSELEYCVSYRNIGTGSITDVEVMLPVPFHTELLGGVYDGATDIRWDDSGTVRFLTKESDGDAALISGLLMTLDVGNGADLPLTPGAQGKVCFQVTIR